MRRILYLKVLAVIIFFIFGANTVQAQSADIFFSLPSKPIQQGDRFAVEVRIQSPILPINAVSGVISFPSNLASVISVSKDKSIINLWTNEPKALQSKIPFEGVILNPGFQGDNGLIFSINFEAKRTGTVFLNFTEGAILANDGLGTNVLGSLKSLSFAIKSVPPVPIPRLPETAVINTDSQTLPVIVFPVITTIVPPISPFESFILKGKGSPNALTKIHFQDITEPSLGIKLVRYLIKDRVPLRAVEVKNDSEGVFSYVSPTNLVAGVYNAVPEYVSDDKTESVIGAGIKLFIQENAVSKVLIIIINALVLIVPILSLILIIIFLPWYFIRRIHVMRKQMEFEEQKIEAEENKL